MLLDNVDAKFVKYSSNGKVFGVHAVDIDSEQNHEISNTKQNFVLEWRLIQLRQDQLLKHQKSK